MTASKMMKIVKVGFINQDGRPIDWEFDGSPRLKMSTEGVWNVYAGYSREQLEAAIRFHEREKRVPEPFEVVNEWDSMKNPPTPENMGDVLNAVKQQAQAVINANSGTAIGDAPLSSFDAAPEAQESMENSPKDCPARVTEKREDVFFNFPAHLDQIVLKDEVSLKMTTSELPEAELSTGEKINLSKAADNEVDVEIRMSYLVKLPKIEIKETPAPPIEPLLGEPTIETPIDKAPEPEATAEEITEPTPPANEETIAETEQPIEQPPTIPEPVPEIGETSEAPKEDDLAI